MDDKALLLALFDSNRDAYVLACQAGNAQAERWPEMFALERQARDAGASPEHIEAARRRALRAGR